MFVSPAPQLLLVSLAVAAFFVVLGALAVGPEVRDELTEEMAGSFSARAEYMRLRSARQPSAAAPAATGD